MIALSETPTSESLLGQEIHEVELLCEQGHFGRALQQAQRLLRENPSSAVVHELLGDVAARRGDHEEAVQWYELSLRLGFDQDVMDKLHQERAAIAAPAVSPAPSAADGSGRAGARPRHYTLIGMIAGGAVLLGALVLLFVTLGGRSGDGDGSEAYGTSAGGAVAPHRRAGGRATPTRGREQPATATSPMPGSAAAAPITSGGGGPLRSGQPDPGELPPVHIHRDIGAPLTDQDLSLLTALASLHWPGGQRLSGDVNVMLDPFTGYAFVTIEIPRSLKQAVVFTTALQMAYRVAVAAVKHDASIRSLTVRVIMRVAVDDNAKESTITVFRGNTNRQSLDRYLREDLEPDSREIWYEVFATCWWNPSLSTAKPFT